MGAMARQRGGAAPVVLALTSTGITQTGCGVFTGQWVEIPTYTFDGTVYIHRWDALCAAIHEALAVAGVSTRAHLASVKAGAMAFIDDLLSMVDVEISGAVRDGLTGDWDSEPVFATRPELVKALCEFPFERLAHQSHKLEKAMAQA